MTISILAKCHLDRVADRSFLFFPNADSLAEDIFLRADSLAEKTSAVCGMFTNYERAFA